MCLFVVLPLLRVSDAARGGTIAVSMSARGWTTGKGSQLVEAAEFASSVDPSLFWRAIGQVSEDVEDLYASPTRHTDGTRMRYYTQRKSLRHGAQHYSRKEHVTSHHGQRQQLKMSSLALHVK